MASAQLVWDDRGIWRTATARVLENHNQAIFWFPVKDPSRFQVYARLIQRLALLHFGPRRVGGIRGHTTFREDAGSDYIIFQAIPDVPVALAMAPPQKQIRTEDGGRWKCGVVYLAGTDTNDPRVSDAVRAYHVLGEKFSSAVQENCDSEDCLGDLSRAAQAAMADPYVIAMFRPPHSVLPLPPIDTKQEFDERSERSHVRSRRVISTHNDYTIGRLSRSRSRSPHRSREDFLIRDDPGLHRSKAEDPISWDDDQLGESTTVMWDRVGQRLTPSPRSIQPPQPSPPGRSRDPSGGNPFIPSPVRLPQKSEPRDPYAYTRRH